MFQLGVLQLVGGLSFGNFSSLKILLHGVFTVIPRRAKGPGYRIHQCTSFVSNNLRERPLLRLWIVESDCRRQQQFPVALGEWLYLQALHTFLPDLEGLQCRRAAIERQLLLCLAEGLYSSGAQGNLGFLRLSGPVTLKVAIVALVFFIPLLVAVLTLAAVAFFIL
ncbi:hypothetical protein D3C81_1672670 [compost metagenome]